MFKPPSSRVPDLPPIWRRPIDARPDAGSSTASSETPVTLHGVPGAITPGTQQASAFARAAQAAAMVAFQSHLRDIPHLGNAPADQDSVLTGKLAAVFRLLVNARGGLVTHAAIKDATRFDIVAIRNAVARLRQRFPDTIQKSTSHPDGERGPGWYISPESANRYAHLLPASDTLRTYRTVPPLPARSGVNAGSVQEGGRQWEPVGPLPPQDMPFGDRLRPDPGPSLSDDDEPDAADNAFPDDYSWKGFLAEEPRVPAASAGTRPASSLPPTGRPAATGAISLGDAADAPGSLNQLIEPDEADWDSFLGETKAPPLLAKASALPVAPRNAGRPEAVGSAPVESIAILQRKIFQLMELLTTPPGRWVNAARVLEVTEDDGRVIATVRAGAIKLGTRIEIHPEDGMRLVPLARPQAVHDSAPAGKRPRLAGSQASNPQAPRNAGSVQEDVRRWEPLGPLPPQDMNPLEPELPSGEQAFLTVHDFGHLEGPDAPLRGLEADVFRLLVEAQGALVSRATLLDKTELNARDIAPVIERLRSTLKGAIRTNNNGKGWSVSPEMANKYAHRLPFLGEPPSRVRARFEDTAPAAIEVPFVHRKIYDAGKIILRENAPGSYELRIDDWTTPVSSTQANVLAPLVAHPDRPVARMVITGGNAAADVSLFRRINALKKLGLAIEPTKDPRGYRLNTAKSRPPVPAVPTAGSFMATGPQAEAIALRQHLVTDMLVMLSAPGAPWVGFDRLRLLTDGVDEALPALVFKAGRAAAVRGMRIDVHPEYGMRLVPLAPPQVMGKP